MAYVTFTATRSLVSGTTSGTSVSLQIDVAKADHDPDVIQQEKKSLGGTPRRNVHRFEEKWSIETVPVAGTSRDLLLMFLESVRAGEAFLADWEADDGSNLKSYMVEKSYRPSRVFASTFRYSFKCFEI